MFQRQRVDDLLVTLAAKFPPPTPASTVTGTAPPTSAANTAPNTKAGNICLLLLYILYFHSQLITVINLK